MRTRLVASSLVGLAAVGVARAQYDCTGIPETFNSKLASVRVADGLTNVDFVTAPPRDPGRIFIVEQGGRIRIHKRGQPHDTLVTFLDISSKVDSTTNGEMGLLGLAFDPDYLTTGRFWVYYTETVGGQIYSVLARYVVSGTDRDRADPASEVRVLRILKPDPNHNAGMLSFGPDGFLYVFTGDGGGGGDQHGPCGNAQNLSVLLGKILRLDVRGVDSDSAPPDCGQAGATYRVPSTNPFFDGPGGFCDEIWAYGLRNPWRDSFDALTGDLYVADVGQQCWEEVNVVPNTSTGGENFGWRQMEGMQCYNPSEILTCNPSPADCGSAPPCHDPSITLPILTYTHGDLGECAIQGGYVYRGCRMPKIRGTYFYGDYCAGFVRTFQMMAGLAVNTLDVTHQIDPGDGFPGNLSTFGVDAQGELYTGTLWGEVRKVVPPFDELEVSARGSAEQLRLSRTEDWTWEDLFSTDDIPVSFYRVYRGSLEGQYACIYRSSTPSWPAGGDPTKAAPGQLFTYVVTAVNDYGKETLPGTHGSFDASTCP